MKKNIANKISALCVILIIAAGCKAHKPLVAAPVSTAPVAVDNTKANTLAAIKGRQLSFTTFSGKASTSLNIDNNNNNVTMNIRIDHGKQIWVSVTALLGLEVARASITPDSIKIINKLQGVYIKKPFSYIHTYAGKQVNFATVEALLTGNAVPALLTTDAELQRAGVTITLSGKLEQLIYTMLFNPDMKLTQLNLGNVQLAQSLQVNNSEFVQVDNRVLPSQIAIASDLKGKKISVNLHYTKVELDRMLEYPFNIPETYTPAN